MVEDVDDDLIVVGDRSQLLVQSRGKDVGGAEEVEERARFSIRLVRFFSGDVEIGSGAGD